MLLLHHRHCDPLQGLTNQQNIISRKASLKKAEMMYGGLRLLRSLAYFCTKQIYVQFALRSQGLPISGALYIGT
jgi:hypothetical protein